MRQPSRRTFLGAAGLVFTAAGCLREQSERSGTATKTKQRTSTTTEPPATVSLGTEQTVSGVSVTLSSLSVQDSVLILDDDAMTLHTADGERYVIVSVSGSESGPSPEAFSLVVDGTTYPGRSDLFGRHAQLDERGPVYDPSYGTERGWVGFVVPPALGANEVRVELTHGDETASWRVEADHLDTLRRPKATFELRAVEIPETLRPYDPVSVRVVAENVSDVAGVFRGVLNVAGLDVAYAPYPFALNTAPGETAVWEKTFTQGPSRAVGSVGFFLDTVAGGREVRAPVESRAEATARTENTTATQ